MHPDLEQRLRFCRNLPTLPRVAMSIIELGNDPNAGVSEVAEAITPDPALSAKFLKVANSALYGLRRKTENLRQALSLLGFNTAVTLALSFSLGNSLGGVRRDDSLDRMAYWRRSVVAGTACRVLGQQQGISALEELFLAGLLQDIGMLVFYSMMPDEYSPIVVAAKTHDQLFEAEHKYLGADHAEVGAWLLQQWNLPEFLQRAVAGSHSPTCVEAPAHPPGIVTSVALSGRIADVLLFPEEQQFYSQAAEAAEQWLEMSEVDFREALDKVAEALPEIAALLEVELPDPMQSLALLDQARETLVNRNLKLLKEASEAKQKAEILEHRTQILEKQTHHDALTGLFNRGYLDIMVGKEFEQATRHGWPLTLAFIDLDHFKSINDTYGHQAGDQVLMAVAQLLSSGIRETDILARYGGEEFMLVLPGTGMEAGQKVLYRLLEAIRKREYTVGEEQSIRVTASVGLSSHMDNGRQYAEVAELVRVADQALYEAKRKGRDRVVVF